MKKDKITCWCFKSVGDDSSGIYQRVSNDKWQLVAVINPEAAERWNHPYPDFVDNATIVRFKTHCSYLPVQTRAAFIMGTKR